MYNSTNITCNQNIIKQTAVFVKSVVESPDGVCDLCWLPAQVSTS